MIMIAALPRIRWSAFAPTYDVDTTNYIWTIYRAPVTFIQHEVRNISGTFAATVWKIYSGIIFLMCCERVRYDCLWYGDRR